MALSLNLKFTKSLPLISFYFLAVIFSGKQQAASTMHWGADFPSNQWPRTHYELNIEEGFDSDFHVYGVEWTPGTSYIFCPVPYF